MNDRFYVDLADGRKIIAKTNICATGVEYARLKLDNETAFFNNGLHYGAGAGEANFCKNVNVFIIGGGNSAGQAACYFSSVAKKVYMVIRKGGLAETLSDYLLQRVVKLPNIVMLLNSQVVGLDGDNVLTGVNIYNSQTEKNTWYQTTKLFVCIGGKPNTEWAAEIDIIRDPNGYLVTGSDLVSHADYKTRWEPDRLPYHFETSMPGSFAAGDVRFNSVKRVASAVGEGAMAVKMVHQYLANHTK